MMRDLGEERATDRELKQCMEMLKDQDRIHSELASEWEMPHYDSPYYSGGALPHFYSQGHQEQQVLYLSLYQP